LGCQARAEQRLSAGLFHEIIFLFGRRLLFLLAVSLTYLCAATAGIGQADLNRLLPALDLLPARPDLSFPCSCSCIARFTLLEVLYPYFHRDDFSGISVSFLHCGDV